MPRIFLNDTPEDRAAIQPALSQILVYPLSQFDGTMKTKDWRKLPSFPVPKDKNPPKYIRARRRRGSTRRHSSPGEGRLDGWRRRAIVRDERHEDSAHQRLCAIRMLLWSVVRSNSKQLI